MHGDVPVLGTNALPNFKSPQAETIEIASQACSFSGTMAREYDHLFKLLIIGDSGKFNSLAIIAVRVSGISASTFFTFLS